MGDDEQTAEQQLASYGTGLITVGSGGTFLSMAGMWFSVDGTIEVGASTMALALVVCAGLIAGGLVLLVLGTR